MHSLKATKITTNNLSARDAKALQWITNAAERRGWAVSVHDGEGWALKRSHDAQAIAAAAESVEAPTLRFRGAGGDPVGSLFLVWGNDGECYANASVDNGGPFDDFTESLAVFIDSLLMPHG